RSLRGGSRGARHLPGKTSGNESIDIPQAFAGSARADQPGVPAVARTRQRGTAQGGHAGIAALRSDPARSVAGLASPPIRYGCRRWRPASNAQSRAAVTGYSLMRSPKGASAFSIAEMIAPAAGTQPDSPTPLTPSGLRGEGNSANVTSMFGTSVALGMR